jgi:hypothetical protein
MEGLPVEIIARDVNLSNFPVELSTSIPLVSLYLQIQYETL